LGALGGGITGFTTGPFSGGSIVTGSPQIGHVVPSNSFPHRLHIILMTLLFIIIPWGNYIKKKRRLWYAVSIIRVT